MDVMKGLYSLMHNTYPNFKNEDKLKQIILWQNSQKN